MLGKDPQKYVDGIAKLMEPAPEKYRFNAIKGKQSKYDVFTVMIPFDILNQMFHPDDEENPELRSQRLVNKSRAGKITSYVRTNQNFILPSLTATIKDYIPKVEMVIHHEDDFKTYYVEKESDAEIGKVITLEIPKTSRLFFIDGQHRATGIKMLSSALAASGMTVNDMFPDDVVPVMLRIDTGLTERQAHFSTINSTMVKPNANLNHLYQNKSRCGLMINLAIKKNIDMKMIEFDKASCSGKNPKLFPYRLLVESSLIMLDAKIDDHIDDSQQEHLDQMWEIFINNPAWDNFRAKPASESRDNLILPHAVFIQAYAHALKSLRIDNKSFNKCARKLFNKIDYSRTAMCWESLCVKDGKLVKNSKSVSDVRDFILQQIGEYKG